MKPAIIAVCLAVFATRAHGRIVPSNSNEIEEPKSPYQGPWAPLDADGNVVDTEEVKIAKAEHAAAMKKAIDAINDAAAKIQSTSADNIASKNAQVDWLSKAHSPEEEKARDEAVAAMKKWESFSSASTSHSSSSSSQHYSYLGSSHEIGDAQGQAQKNTDTNMAQIGPDGNPLPTPEVVAETDKQLAALKKAYDQAYAAAAKAQSYGAQGQTVVSGPSSSDSVQTSAVQVQKNADGKWAQIGPDGNPLQTPEVVDATAEFMAKWQKAWDEATAAATAAKSHEGQQQTVVSTAAATHSAPAISATQPQVNQGSSAIPDQTRPVTDAPVQTQKNTKKDCAQIGPDGNVLQTPEVINATAEFMAKWQKAWNEATAAATAAKSQEAQQQTVVSTAHLRHSAPAVSAPQPQVNQGSSAIPDQTRPVTDAPAQALKHTDGKWAEIGPDGNPLQTPEVVDATAEFMAKWQKAWDEATAAATVAKSHEAQQQTVVSTAHLRHSAPAVSAPQPQVNQGSSAIPDQTGPVTDAPAQAQKHMDAKWAQIGPDGNPLQTPEVVDATAEFMAKWQKAWDEATAAATATKSHEGQQQTVVSTATATHSAPAISATQPQANQGSSAIPVQSSAATDATVQAQKNTNENWAQIGADGNVLPTPEVVAETNKQLTVLMKAYAESRAAATNAESYSARQQTVVNVPASKHSAPAVSAPQPPVKQASPAIPVQTEPVTDAPAQAQKHTDGKWAEIGPDGKPLHTPEVVDATAEFMAKWQKAWDEATAAATAAKSHKSQQQMVVTTQPPAYSAPAAKSNEAPEQAVVTAAPPSSPTPGPVSTPQPHNNNGPQPTLIPDDHKTHSSATAGITSHHSSTSNESSSATKVTTTESKTFVGQGAHEGSTAQAPIASVPQVQHQWIPTGASIKPIQYVPCYTSPCYQPPTQMYPGYQPAVYWAVPVQQPLVYTRFPGTQVHAGQGTFNGVGSIQRNTQYTTETKSASATSGHVAAVHGSYTYGTPAHNIQTVPATVVGSNGELSHAHSSNPIGTTNEDPTTVTTSGATIKPISVVAGEAANAASTVASEQPFTNRATNTGPWKGPLAPLDSDGNVVDTDEVKEQKMKHMATLAKLTADAIERAHNKVPGVQKQD